MHHRGSYSESIQENTNNLMGHDAFMANKASKLPCLASKCIKQFKSIHKLIVHTIMSLVQTHLLLIYSPRYPVTSQKLVRESFMVEVRHMDNLTGCASECHDTNTPSIDSLKSWLSIGKSTSKPSPIHVFFSLLRVKWYALPSTISTNHKRHTHLSTSSALCFAQTVLKALGVAS